MKRRIPTLLAMFFVLVTVTRVAHFAGGTWLAWFFAIGLAVGVFIASYFTDWKSTRHPATIALIFFLIFDTIFNLGETLAWSVRTGRWYLMVDFGLLKLPVYRIADIGYGIFPTSAAALLGWLSRKTEGLGGGRRKASFWEMAKYGIIEWLFGEVPNEPKTKKAKPAPKPEREPETMRKISADLPGWLPRVPINRSDWRLMIEAGEIVIPETMSGAALGRILQITDRSGRNYLNDYFRLTENQGYENDK